MLAIRITRADAAWTSGRIESLPLAAPATRVGQSLYTVLWQKAVVLRRLTERKEWQFFAVLPKAAPGLAAACWTVLLLRGILPAGFAIAMGVLVGAVQRGDGLAAPLAFAGTIFVLLQVLSPIHQAISANLGDRTAAWLYYRLTEAGVRPPGMGRTARNPLRACGRMELW